LAGAFDKLMKLMELFFKPLNYVANKLEENYTGRFRGISQSLFVIGLIFIVSSPIIVYTSLLMLQLPQPYSYISFSLWVGFMAFILLCEIYVGYTQGKRIIENLSKDFVWDIEKYSEEYFKMLEKNAKQEKKQSKAATS